MYRKFLFYYSLIISSVLFIWIVLFLPRPESLVPLVLFLPIVIHFWLGVIWPSKISELAGPGSQNIDALKKQLFSFSMTVMISIVVATFSILIYAFAYERYSPIVNALNTKNPKAEELLLILGKINSIEKDSKNLDQKLEKIYDAMSEGAIDEKSEVTKERISEVLERADSTSTNSGVLKILKETKAYDDKNPNSKINGTLYSSQIYNFTKKDGLWYLVTLPDFKEGWVEKEYILEL